MAREQRLVFGEDPELYDRARPSYPAALIRDLTRLDGLEPTSCWAADVGCGTGKATVLLAGAGVRGVGIEADPGMAAVAERQIAPFGTWRIDRSGFEAWEPHEGEPGFDLITSAWHWVDPATRFGIAHRRLRPRGWLALWWNRPDDDEAPLRAEIEAIYADQAPTMPSGIGEKGKPHATWHPGPEGFEPPVEHGYPWSRTYSAAEWTDLMRTQSDHRLLPPAERESLLDAVGRAIERNGGAYAHRYVCWLWAARSA